MRYNDDMKRLFVILLCLLFMFGLIPPKALAVVDPLNVPNNKFGIHILFPDEVTEAAKLINSNGGDWGYVTIPIQAGDKNLTKWQKFFNDCKKNHLIPLLRLATEGDYFNTQVWRKPNSLDILDFANFLSSLNWPTMNRYVIVFNEVNRGDEWGGSPSPSEYAQLLSYAVTVFKSKSQDFFIISAGLDNASATVYGKSYNQYDFMREMNNEIPSIYYQVDGMASHSYPNPGFSQPPTTLTATSISSFRYESSLAGRLGSKKLPIFITETGWSRAFVSDETAASYYKTAFSNVWSDENVVAVTPFLFQAFDGPFTAFSFVKSNNNFSAQYLALKDMQKTQGSPFLSSNILGDSTHEVSTNLTIKSFQASQTAASLNSEQTSQPPQAFKTFLKWLIKY